MWQLARSRSCRLLLLLKHPNFAMTFTLVNQVHYEVGDLTYPLISYSKVKFIIKLHSCRLSRLFS